MRVPEWTAFDASDYTSKVLRLIGFLVIFFFFM